MPGCGRGGCSRCAIPSNTQNLDLAVHASEASTFRPQTSPAKNQHTAFTLPLPSRTHRSCPPNLPCQSARLRAPSWPFARQHRRVRGHQMSSSSQAQGSSQQNRPRVTAFVPRPPGNDKNGLFGGHPYCRCSLLEMPSPSQARPRSARSAPTPCSLLAGDSSLTSRFSRQQTQGKRASTRRPWLALV